MVLFAALLTLSCGSCASSQSEAYLQAQYQPRIMERPTRTLPSAARVDGVPWIAFEKNRCQTAALQMIAAHCGVQASGEDLTFLIGYTLGCIYVKGAGQFIPMGDPEPGILLACRILGLERNYLTTQDPEVFLACLRERLAFGQPVKINWDASYS